MAKRRSLPVQAVKMSRLDREGEALADLLEKTPLGRWLGHALILAVILLSLAVTARIVGLY